MPKSRAYAVLLRGINVGGANRAPMAGLRALCEAAGCTDVQTYIQSGNAVLASTLDEAALREALQQGVKDEFGLTVEVMVRTAAEMSAAVSHLPYPETPESVHVGFLHAPPKDPAALEAIDCAPESLRVVGREIYFYLPGGMGRAKLPVELGRCFKKPMTVRNWRTVTKLAEMAAARAK